MIEATELSFRPLSAATGAEVSGIDARQPQPDGVKRQLIDALHKYGLLLFRAPDLALEDQRRFAEIFGEISEQGESAKRLHGTVYVSNRVQGGTLPAGELAFHFDHSFYPTPPRFVMMYGLQVPPHGGETMFANAHVAYDLLPQALKKRIENLAAMHCFDYAYARGERQAVRIREWDLGPDQPQATHPIALSHPVTGQKILYVSRRHTDRIIGLPDDESEALLDELWTYIEGNPQIVYTHAWTAGDLLLWDNLMLLHARNDFDPQYERTLRRFSLATLPLP